MKRLLVVEDDRSLGLTLQERLLKEGFDVELVPSLAKARDAIKRKFDLIILDVGLPDGSGFDFATEVKGAQNSPFLFMTAQSDAESRLQGYEAGAEEFIPKPFHLKEFLLRVKHVLENHAAPDVYELGMNDKVNFESFVISVGGHEESLTQKEMMVLKTLIESSPKVVSRDDLLNRVWGEEAFPTQRTIDNVILRLRSVLGSEYGSKIQSVRGVGYKWS